MSSNHFKKVAISISLFVFFCSAITLAGQNNPDKPLIFPIPQQIEIGEGSFEINEKTVILVTDKPSPQDLSLAKFLTAEIADRFGVALKTQQAINLPKNKNVIIMGSLRNSLVRKYCKKTKVKITVQNPGPQGYILNVNDNSILIAGSDDVGAFYGLQSLRQLIKKQDKNLIVPKVKVKDFPYKPFRGLRIYVPGKDNLQFFKRFVRDFMAMYKFNKVILEVNAVMRLDRHPELNAGAIEFAKELTYSRRDRPKGPHQVIQDSAHYDAGDSGLLEKAELAEIVNYAKSLNIEVIPEIASLTHSYYLLARHRDLAEVPPAAWPDTYCPLNPDSYKLLFDVLDEYIEVIKPKMVHIGHDEWRMPINFCPNCKDKDHGDLYIEDVNKIHTYLASKGIKVAMWGDHLVEAVKGKGLRYGSSSVFPGPLLSKDEVKKKNPTAYTYRLPGAVPEEKVIKSVPKDILVFNWFWQNQNNDTKLQEMGFKQVYGNFTSEISNWAERTSSKDILGGAPSSWAATTEHNFGKDHLVNYLGCANLLWSTHWPEKQVLLTKTRTLIPQIHRSLNGKWQPSQDGDAVVPVEISPQFNISRLQELNGKTLKNLRVGKIIAGKKVFNLADPGQYDGKTAIAIASNAKEQTAIPKAVEGIKIGKDLTSLIFLQACAKPAQNNRSYSTLHNFPDTADMLGWYEIVYEDGFVETVPIRYGVNILEWDRSSENYCYKAEPVNCADANSTEPVTFFAFEWVNARLGKKIAEINLKATAGFKDTQGKIIQPNTLVLLALSKVEKRPTADTPPPAFLDE